MIIALARIALAVVSGAVVYTSYAPLGWWIAAIGGIGMLYAALSPWGKHRVGPGLGVVIAMVHSLTLYLLVLPWIGELVGTFPYVALAVWLSIYAIALGWGGAHLARRRWGFAAFPLFYLAVEFVRDTVPFGGFPWVRLAWGQVEGPLANLMPWGGPALVTVVTALIGTSLFVVVFRSGLRHIGAVTALVPLALAVVAGFGINRPGPTVGEVNVAAIQGNVPRLGLDFNAQRRAVLANHVRMTNQLAEDIKQQNLPGVDLVLWPENSSDVNPFTDEQARSLIDSAVNAVGAPALVGTLTRDEVGERNTMQVFSPGDAGSDTTVVGDHHYKKYLQPFGETMPMRDFFRQFSDYVDLAGDFKPGDGPGVVDMNGITVGVATCYEVIFDDAFYESIRNGAQILATPTNNATFGFSDMTYQQLAMSRMRAMETDRAVVVPATSGVSAIVHPDGSVSQQTNIFQAKYLVEQLPLRDSVTPAVRFGKFIELAMVIIGGACAVFAWAQSRAAAKR